MSPIRYDETIMRLIRDVNEIKSALRRTVANLPLFDIANENTPAVLTANQNNYVPGNYDVIRIASTQEVSITGIANGKKGRRLQIFNIGLYSITLAHSSASSLAANRFDFVNDSDFIIPPSGNILLYYDSTQERWVGGDMASIYDVVNEVTPAQITADQNNYDIGLAEVLRLSTDANRSITGFFGGVKGRFLEILNVGNYRITIPNENTSSSAANRVITPYEQSVVLLPDARTTLYYDSTQQRWTVSDLPNIQGQFGKYAVLASANSPYMQEIPDLEYRTVRPDSVLSDEWSYWDSANYKFVIPEGESGLYSLSLNFIISAGVAGTDYYFLLYPIINAVAGSPPTGTSLNYFRLDANSSNSYGGTVNLFYYCFMDSGDDLSVYAYHNLAADVKIAVLSTVSPVFTFSKVG